MTSVALLLNSSAKVDGVDLQLRWSGQAGDPLTGTFNDVLSSGPVSDAATDLLTLAIGVYAADKAVLRKRTDDRWTRTIELHLPLIEPSRFPEALLIRFLVHLTGDHWRIVSYASDDARRKFSTSGPGSATPSAPRVALFSGGLDSFAHHAETASAPHELIAHKDRSQLGQRQLDLARGLSSAASIRQFTFTVQRGGPLDYELESSTRSRSLLFISTAVAFADAQGSKQVVVPDNGFISLNPPLVPARRGTLSTRTTHPWTLHMLNELLRALPLDVEVHNPYINYTKGDITDRALQSAPASAIFRTISCSRARARRSDPLHFGNCGYCYPCLVRRAGIHRSGTADATPYRRNPLKDLSVLGGPSGDDLKAVANGVRRHFTIHDLVSSTPLPPGSDYAALEDVIERGRVEIVEMIEAGLTAKVRRAIGW